MFQEPYSTGCGANGPQLDSPRVWFLLCQERPGQAAQASDVGPTGWRPASAGGSPRPGGGRLLPHLSAGAGPSPSQRHFCLPSPRARLQEQCHGREGLAHRRRGLGDFEVKVNRLTSQAGCQPPQHRHGPGPLLGCGCPWRSAASNIPQDLGFLLSESRTSGFPGEWWALT